MSVSWVRNSAQMKMKQTALKWQQSGGCTLFLMFRTPASPVHHGHDWRSNQPLE